MARVKRGVTTHARHKKILNLAKGYRGRGSTAYRIAIEKVEKALRYAYRDRRNRKRDFRALWIQRINAGAREHGLTYSQFMHGIKLAGLDLDRKVLSDLAIREPEAFQAIAGSARAALDSAPPAVAAERWPARSGDLATGVIASTRRIGIQSRGPQRSALFCCRTCPWKTSTRW